MSYQINQLFVSYVYTTNMQAWKKSELKKTYLYQNKNDYISMLC